MFSINMFAQKTPMFARIQVAIMAHKLEGMLFQGLCREASFHMFLADIGRVLHAIIGRCFSYYNMNYSVVNTSLQL